VHYLAVKSALIRASPLRRADARTMFRLDAHRAGAVYDLLLSCGLVADAAAARAATEPDA
jgi:hypothetical protein